MTDLLTIKERESIRAQVIATMRQRLDERKPDENQYTTAESRDTRFIAATLRYSRAAIPVIALLAAIGSSIRTVQVVSSLYSSAGSHPVGVLIAAIAFTLAAEGALFVLALAAAGEELRARAEQRPRHVTSAATVYNALMVRLGRRQPKAHHELPPSEGGIKTVIMIALLFTLTTNLYLGLKPIVDGLGATSLQDFFSSLWTASAELQLTAVVDIAAALFAPLMAYTAGHITARYAADITERSSASRSAYERELTIWREQRADPLATDEGRELLEEYTRLKMDSKAARSRSAARPTQPAEEYQPPQIYPTPATYTNGNGHSAPNGRTSSQNGHTHTGD